MVGRGPILYFAVNMALFALLWAATGRPGASAASVVLLNVYVLLARRAYAFEEVLPEEDLAVVLSTVGLSLRRGRPLPRALAAGAVAAGPHLAGPLIGLVRQLDLGVPLERALSGTRAPAVEPAFSAAMWALVFAEEAGADHPALLERITRGLSRQLDLKRQFQVMAVNGRLSAIALSALPVCLVAALLPFRPAVFSDLAATPWGVPLLIALAALWVAGLRVIHRVSGADPSAASNDEQRVEAELPLLMELFAAGLELGNDPRALAVRLGRGMRPGPLREALRGLTARCDLGLTLSRACAEEAAASPVPAWRLFNTVLGECGRGHEAGGVLRFQAEELRARRHYRLAAAAQRRPFLIVLALVLLVMPLTFGLLLVPAIARLAAMGY